MYNPNQRKPSNQKKKRKLKRKAMQLAAKKALLKQKAEQGPKVDQLTLYSLPYVLKLQKITESVNGWYDDLELDFTFRETLLENRGWFSVSFVNSRLGQWTNHGIVINAFLQQPGQYDVQRIDVSLDTFPPLPDTFAQEAAHWRDYEYDAEDFHEEEWFDLQTDLDDIRKRLEMEDDSMMYDALVQRTDFSFESIQRLDDQVKREAEEERKQYPKLFGDEHERKPVFGYSNTTSQNEANIMSDLSSLLSKRKHQD